MTDEEVQTIAEAISRVGREHVTEVVNELGYETINETPMPLLWCVVYEIARERTR